MESAVYMRALWFCECETNVNIQFGQFTNRVKWMEKGERIQVNTIDVHKLTINNLLIQTNMQQHHRRQ